MDVRIAVDAAVGVVALASVAAAAWFAYRLGREVGYEAGLRDGEEEQ